MDYVHIQFFNEDITYRIEKKKEIRQWIIATINHEGKVAGNLNFIFCSDKLLQSLNISYLHDDAFTDVITFDYSENERMISGDIYLSIERIRQNAVKYRVRIKDEVHRVMLHGILHLLGYMDKDKEQKKNMRRIEGKYLSLRPQNL
jgi:rRNA maturation RNase YbeY